MLKMTVRPLAIKNSSMPNNTPLSVEMTISSSTTHRLESRIRVRPEFVRGGRVKRERSVRPFHLAGGRKHGRGSVDLRNELPAPAGLFLVERFLFGAFAKRGNIDRLEELVIVLPHVALAAVEHLELHAFERKRDLDRIDRLGLVGRGRQHPHLVDGAGVEQAEVVFGADRLFEILRSEE